MGNRQAFWLARDISLTVAAQPRTCTDVSLRCYGLQACVVILSYRLRIWNAGEGGNFFACPFKVCNLDVMAVLCESLTPQKAGFLKKSPFWLSIILPARKPRENDIFFKPH